MLTLFAIWVLLCSLDDLFLDLAFLYRWFVTACLGRGSISAPTAAELAAAPKKSIAIFVPLWREHKVIHSMIEYNVVAHRHDHCEFFVGVYPNDELTAAAARDLEARMPNVHVSMCPHDGPTSKADNLNWIFQRMMLFESGRQARFDIVITHDAEDLIHPEALRWISYYSRRYDMVQIPVLPFPTPLRELVHGAYCDEFAEYQCKDLPTRQFLGGFLPSCGVGAGFSRNALDRLGAAYGNRIFEPKCLTEDYENGFRLHRLGCSQLFVPVMKWKREMVATRGYFPRRFRLAVKQKTRWVMGIALQSWELNGWRETMGQLYWFWRDRKGLVGSLVGPVANLVFLYGVADWYTNPIAGNFSRAILSGASAWILGTFALSMVLQAVHMAMRIRFSARVYGSRFAFGAPARILLSNAINFLATACAIGHYVSAKCSGRPLVWLKTDNAYPSRKALIAGRPRLGEILVGYQYIPVGDIEAALATLPPGIRIGEYLVFLGKLTEHELYECLSVQESLSFQILDRAQICRAVTRSLPAAVSRKWQVLGYKVVSGQLFVASPDVPCDEMNEDLRRFSSLEIRFHLITPGNFERLRLEFLPRALPRRKTEG